MEKNVEELGTIKQIDEMGRVALPRELRKLLNLKEGAKIELGVEDGDKLVIKKYSPMNTLNEWANYIISSISSVVEHDIVLTDVDKELSSSKKKYLNKTLTMVAQEVIYKREIVIKKQQDESNMLDVFNDLEEDFCCELIVPIIKDNDVLGSIMVLAVENKCFDNDTAKVCKAFSNFLSLVI